MKKAIVFILNFLLVIWLTFLCIITILSKTALSKNYIEGCLEKSNFYDELNKSIQNEFDTYLAQVGISSGALKELYTSQELKDDINSTLDAIYNNETINVTNSLMTEKIKKQLKNYTANTEQLANQLTNIYKKKVAISSKYINAIGPKVEEITSIINIGIIVIVGILIFVLTIMCAIIRNFKVIINHLGIMLCTTGILNIIMKICVGTRFNHIFLLNKAFSNGIIYIINNIIDKIMSIGIGFTVIGLVLIICGNFKKTEKHETSNETE